jgi:hypothetical protein
MATMHRTTEVIIKAKIHPTIEDLLTTLRTACDPRSCLFNLSTVRALTKQLKGSVTKVWVDGGHTRFTWEGKRGATAGLPILRDGSRMFCRPSINGTPLGARRASPAPSGI